MGRRSLQGPYGGRMPCWTSKTPFTRSWRKSSAPGRWADSPSSPRNSPLTLAHPLTPGFDRPKNMRFINSAAGASAQWETIATFPRGLTWTTNRVLDWIRVAHRRPGGGMEKVYMDVCGCGRPCW